MYSYPMFLLASAGFLAIGKVFWSLLKVAYENHLASGVDVRASSRGIISSKPSPVVEEEIRRGQWELCA